MILRRKKLIMTKLKFGPCAYLKLFTTLMFTDGTSRRRLTGIILFSDCGPYLTKSNIFQLEAKFVAFWLIFVACLWGVTNPFIKRGSQGIESIQASTPLRKFLAELSFLITNIKYIVPFLINQSGSVVYYLTLSSADLSLAVPITNSLTFIFTAITGHLLGEKISSRKTILGMLLVVAGVTLCVMDKI